MQIAMTGSSGLIGTFLRARLAREGDTVLRLVRRTPAGPDEARWDPEGGTIDAAALQGLDGVVHLAGEGIGDRRWTAKQKQVLLESRTKGTTLLAETLARLDRPPPVLVSQSAFDYYGDRGDEVLTEDSGPGTTGFLPAVVTAWESAADPAREAGIRVVHPRTGMFLAPHGGALLRLLRVFKLGIGGPFGLGRQYWSWIGPDDWTGLVVHILRKPDLDGPVNAVGPHPITNARFSRTLGQVLRRPALLPVPRFAPAIVYGRGLVDELLFASRRVLPERALASGYSYAHPHLEQCLRHLLDRPE